MFSSDASASGSFGAEVEMAGAPTSSPDELMPEPAGRAAPREGEPSAAPQQKGALPPTQGRMGMQSTDDGWAAEEGLAGTAAGALKQDVDRVEFSSGPHLRGVIGVGCCVLWFMVWMIDGHTQLYCVPLVILCTASTSALWCTPQDLVISLGPVPTCFFRRRIPYKDITSVAVVHGHMRILRALARLSMRRPWQFHACIYGLTFGKDILDVTLRANCPAAGGERAGRLRLFPDRLLISVDEGERIAAHVDFRQKYGAHAPLLKDASVNSRGGFAPVRWVLCDACDVMFQPWKTYQPLALFQDSGRHERTA